jgi:hypothetical protein
MNIERLFGKGRATKGKSRSKDEAKPRPVSPAPAAAEPSSPRMEATDAPASLARGGEGTSASTNAAVTTPIAVASSPVPTTSPTYEEIAARAYDLWLAQDRPDGREHENWLEAERLLRAGQAPG